MDFKPLITLLALVNPIAIVPFFIHYTQGFSSAQRKRTIMVASGSVFAVIAVCAIVGLEVLDFFNISLASFQVGGGMLLLTSALAMLNAQPAEAKATPSEVDDAHSKTSIAVVPLTIPLLTGPATMSTVVIYVDQAQTCCCLKSSINNNNSKTNSSNNNNSNSNNENDNNNKTNNNDSNNDNNHSNNNNSKNFNNSNSSNNSNNNNDNNNIVIVADD